MGLLDSLVGAAEQALAGQGAQASGVQGGGSDLMSVAMGLINQHGGLAGLVQQLQSSGLADQVQSWVSNGANLPVSADQVSGALGGDVMGKLAAQAGLSHGELGAQLAQWLPQIVNHLTPGGQVPATGAGGLGDLAGMLGGLLKQG
ncbi:YidB family protein [Roseateles koreensis]|uniref:YidB family protein n=1 Tax=Roseateles koreensis TaxID=2987526 RepID=A0ABT5KLL8_9BURK|nr:YidB family protein [Roseateles koreensis]MDC8783751.1 YidB family protein [Roseateles koreensis]